MILFKKWARYKVMYIFDEYWMFLFTTINYVHPVLFLLSIFKGYSIGTILHDFISVDIHCESKL